jgi:RHS repeat-associated protein
MRKIFRILVLLLLVQLCGQRLFAQQEPAYVDLLEGDSIYAGKELRVLDTVFFDATLKPTIVRTNYVHNMISLRINEYSHLALPDSFEVSVRISVEYVDTSNRSDSTTERTLTITYNKLHPYRNKAVFYFEGAYYAKVHILDVSWKYGSSTAATQVLQLENRMVIDRDYAMSCTDDAIQTVNRDTSTVSTMGELKITWQPNRVSEMYDVEWTYLDRSAIDNGRYTRSGHLEPALIFRNNASRITTKADTCLIPLLYDGQGTLFYRVRGVQLGGDGELITTEWNSDLDTNNTHWRYDFMGHQRNLNWQASTTFAEEGKSKSVVQYFDGSLRARQTVTRDNTTQTTVVAETFYDQQGRPAIQVMPAPTLSKLIAYTPSFNVADMNSREYDKGIYDTLMSASDYCSTAADSMSVVSGTSQYYSPHNPLKNDSYHQFIPDAKGFAFAETQYEQDNSGLVYRQGGVGTDFRIGSGHETKYYYGKPDTRELDALFGTEAGDASHYQKNMVRDANGQYSVSYVDMHGRTVATALAGASPTSLQALSSYRDTLQSEQLLSPTNNTASGNSINFSTDFFMTKTDSVWLHYNVGKQSLKLEDCRHDSICYDCLYDLTITITGDCSGQVSGQNSKVVQLKNFSLFHVDTACGLATPIDTTIRLVLNEGSYKITKELTISTDGMNRYRDSVYMPRNTCHDYDYFLHHKLSILADSLSCSSDTTASIVSSHYREQMLLGLYPLSGQYGDTASLRSCFSIFDKQGDRYLYQVVADTSSYVNDAGQMDSVVNTAGNLVPPQELTPDEFITNFKDSWAITLLSLHPEYCLLQQYERMPASHAWDDDFEATDTYDAALAKGYLNPTGNTTQLPATNFTINHTDPLFSYSFATGAKTFLEDSLFKFKPSSGDSLHAYITVWGFVTAIAKCGTSITNTCLNHWNQPANSMNADSLACTGEKDMAWRIFRSMYLTWKRSWEDKFIHSQCTSTAYPHIPCTPVFVRRDSAFNGTGLGEYTGAADAAAGQDTANAFYTANCEAYRERWRQQLGSCYNDAQKEVLINYMIHVCNEGADQTHPFGASSVRPSSTYTYKSFDDVFKHVNDSIPNSNVTCSAYLIDKPLPYSQQMFPVNQPLYTKPDSATCNRINTLYTDYQAHTGLYSSFSDYMKKVYNTTITNGALDSLRNLCSGTITCHFLTNPIFVPPILQPGAPPSCINCQVFQMAYDSFAHRFPGITPVMEPADTNQVRYNTLFANYLNNRFGFNKTPQEYLLFKQACGNVTPHATYADTLFHFLDSVRTSDHVPNCAQSFASVFYKQFGLDYTVGQLDTLYTSYGIEFTPCDTMPVNCTQLSQIYDTINCLYNSYQASLVNSGQCNQTPWWFNNLVDGAITIYSTRQYIDTLIENGVFRNMRRPGHLVEAGRLIYESQRNFMVANEYGIEFRMRNNQYDTLGHPYRADVHIGYSSHSFNLSGGDENCGVSFANDSLGNYTYKGVTHYDSALSHLDVNNWHTYKLKATVDSFLFLYDYNVVKRFKRDGNNYIDAINKFNMIYELTKADSLQIDWFKLYGPNDHLIFHEDFDRTPYWTEVPVDTSFYAPVPDCRQFWTTNFNALTGKHMTYEQIRSYYKFHCGLVIDPCGAPDTLTLCGGNAPLDSAILNPQPPSPCADTMNIAITYATQIEQIYKDSVLGHFNEAYTQKCLSIASKETLTITKAISEYHYTLYYYDQAGNLVKTVPPEGVHPNRTSAFLDSVQTRRTTGLDTVPQHTLVTVYRYNTLNQVVSQKTPDGGRSQFWYDRLGRLAISQNAKQRGTTDYSYTRYDAIGRIVEVGQKHQPQGMSQATSRNSVNLQKWIDFRNYDGDYWPVMVTLTGYDEPSLFSSVYEGQTPFHQKAYTLRNRVSYMRSFDRLQVNWGLSGTDTIYGPLHLYFNTAIEYSYDIHGNVDSMLNIGFQGTIANVYGANAFKMIAYKYDLISGKVNEVHYNPGFADEFYHRYEYDADNRLTDVYTADIKSYLGQSGLEDHDAHYDYYKHGPLARTVLGEQQVQGLDYAYTLQGWIKGVNSSSLNPAHDMGGDGKVSGVNNFVARDAIGFNLNYFTGEYCSVSGVSPFAGHTGYMPSGTYKPLYNGNISSMAVNIGQFSQPQLYNYGYDQLNRLVKMDVYRGLDSATNSWSGLTAINDYKERIAYDGNGNIKTYVRHGYSATPDMDSLSYNYYAGTNQLNHVNDGINSANYTTDIDDQPTDNFRYDSIGNMIADSLSDIRNIDWTVYGKIATIYKQPRVPGDAISIEYRYDPLGNRVSKGLNKYSDRNEYVWYVRDAQGNVMAVYDMKYNWDHTFGPFKLIEHHIYGSSRLGIIQRDQDMDSAKATAINESLLGATYVYNANRGNKLYELTNHLGNVLTTISDRKIGHGTGGEYDYYTPDIVSATDYYPFGSEMPNRTYSTPSYRYGFNGKENDNDVKGEGNQQDYGMRIYDPRLGRFLSVDPLTKGYPMMTPYAFAMNDVIRCVDLDGAEKKVVVHWIDGYYDDGAPKIKKTSVDINKTATYINVYTATGLPVGDGKKFAATEVYYALPDGSFTQGNTMYEEIEEGGMLPSANYDYTQNVIPGKSDDDSKYIHQYDDATMPFSTVFMWVKANADLVRRDSKAPDNASTLEDLSGVNAALAVIGYANVKGGGMGKWMEENQAGRSPFTKNYQKQITGRDGQDFLYNGVRFDGVVNGTLVDAKGKYAFLLEKGWAQEGLLKQAQRQIAAAKGANIEWHFAEEAAASTVQQLFKDQGITGITVHYTPSLGKTP